jgi:hypothetical protein
LVGAWAFDYQDNESSDSAIISAPNPRSFSLCVIPQWYCLGSAITSFYRAPRSFKSSVWVTPEEAERVPMAQCAGDAVELYSDPKN